MTAEQRLDRLERIAKLFVAAGLRMRRNMRELGEKIGIVIDFQIESRERSKEQDEKIGMLLKFQKGNEERFQKLAEYQANTDNRLDKLSEILRDLRTGK
jgi:hypothetical protein